MANVARDLAIRRRTFATPRIIFGCIGAQQIGDLQYGSSYKSFDVYIDLLSIDATESGASFVNSSLLIFDEIDDDDDDSALMDNFIEQAEYLPPQTFELLNAEHPDEESIIRRLSGGGAKLLVGPRGCGKTTLMLKTFYGIANDEASSVLPVYVNFKLSLKLEPLYVNTPNAPYWFKTWLNLKIFEGIFSTIDRYPRFSIEEPGLTKKDIGRFLSQIEQGNLTTLRELELHTLDALTGFIESLLKSNDLVRCVLLLDDAAHAFSPRQQEDFFEFFRQIKGREIAPKAAIYPGITTHSPTFHVGHDAEQIDVWIRPDRNDYVAFMRDLAVKRFGGEIPPSLVHITGAVELLAYASFGIPRSFLNMLRTIYLDSKNGTVDRRKVLAVSKQSREMSHGVYESLSNKLPAYREFVGTGRLIYQSLLKSLKDFNRSRADNNQALEVGIRRPLPLEVEKVISFFQYAGLLMPTGENSRGEKGTFELYFVHFGDLVTENVIIGRRAKSIDAFVSAFSAQTHQAYPRISPDSLMPSGDYSRLFRLVLPNCQACGTERANEHAKFCQNCGAQLKSNSVYDTLVNQDISALPLSKRMVKRIKENSSMRTIKDILMDNDRKLLRAIKHIGPRHASRIANYAEEHVA